MGHDETNFNMLSWSEDRKEWVYVFGPDGAAKAPTREKLEELIKERSTVPLEQWTFTQDPRTNWWTAQAPA